MNSLSRKSYFINLILTLILIGLGFSHRAEAANTWFFEGKIDTFSIVEISGQMKIENDVISSKSFSQLAKLFDLSIHGDCPALPKKPDLKIRHQTDAVSSEREFFVKQQTIKSGAQCARLAGFQIYEVPYHRGWFLDSTPLKVSFGDQFKVVSPNVKFEMQRSGEHWIAKSFLLDADFRDQWVSALQSFRVAHHYHPMLAKQSLSTYSVKAQDGWVHFFRLSQDQWAIRFPKKPYLIASMDFSFVPDFKKSQLQSNLSGPSAIAFNSRGDIKARIHALNELRTKGSSEIYDYYEKALLNEDEPLKIRQTIVDNLMTQPTSKNVELLIRLIEKTEKPALLKRATERLRILNRSGNVINGRELSDTLQRRRTEWRTWFNEWQNK